MDDLSNCLPNTILDLFCLLAILYSNSNVIYQDDDSENDTGENTDFTKITDTPQDTTTKSKKTKSVKFSDILATIKEIPYNDDLFELEGSLDDEMREKDEDTEDESFMSYDENMSDESLSPAKKAKISDDTKDTSHLKELIDSADSPAVVDTNIAEKEEMNEANAQNPEMKSKQNEVVLILHLSGNKNAIMAKVDITFLFKCLDAEKIQK